MKINTSRKKKNSKRSMERENSGQKMHFSLQELDFNCIPRTGIYWNVPFYWLYNTHRNSQWVILWKVWKLDILFNIRNAFANSKFFSSSEDYLINVAKLLDIQTFLERNPRAWRLMNYTKMYVLRNDFFLLTCHSQICYESSLAWSLAIC